MDWIYFWISLVLVLIWAIAATWQRDVAKTDLFLAQSEIRSLESAVNSLRVDLVEERKDIRNLADSLKLERQRADANYEKAKELEADLKSALFKLRMVRRALDHDGNPVIGVCTETGNIIRSGDLAETE